MAGGNNEKVFGKIPSLKMHELMNLWRNAVRILAKGNNNKQRDLSYRVIHAIRKEWERRSKTPLNPDEYFKWPDTDARNCSGDLHTEDWVKEGILQFMGYKVGNTDGEPKGVRERILKEIFDGPLPPVFHKPYLDEWGVPASVARLRKLAETIAALTRNAKRRRDSKMAAAIRDWEADLEYLYNELYVGKFHFGWPDSNV